MVSNETFFKYDVTFFITCTNSIPLYRSRLEIFKKYGLVNTSSISYKVILSLNKNDNDQDDIFKNWDCDIEIIKTKYSCDAPKERHLRNAPKVYSFFSNMEKEHIEESRWMIKVDDDSVTNVKGLINALDADYNYKNPLK